MLVVGLCGGGESSPTEPQEPVNQDTLVSMTFLGSIMHYQAYCVRNQEVN